MDETQIMLNTGKMLADIGIVQKFQIISEWAFALFVVIVSINLVKSYAMNLVYYLLMLGEPDFQSIRYQKSSFDVYPEGWEDCTCLAWTRKGMRIYIGSKSMYVSISNSGLYRKDLLIHTQRNQEQALVDTVIHKMEKKKNV